MLIHSRVISVAIAIGFALMYARFSHANPPAADPSVDFRRDVQPILRAHCVECHNADDTNGGLRLDVMTGEAETDSGIAPVVPGKPDESELIVRIRSTSDGDRMPPDGERLNDADIAILTRWVRSGAFIPPNDSLSEQGMKDRVGQERSDHWSFQPIGNPSVPDVQDVHWARGELDRFVQSQRESRNLVPVQDADPVTFIRRVGYTLTGLPPTRDEVDGFVAMVESEGMDIAARRLVDDLLGRVSYGERWGRHWMDWVRYADTAGDNSDFPIPEAYLYRRYIIDSFNDDLPYDRFLTEQLAGDLLPADDQSEKNRQTIATGYLAMARRFGSLVERYPWHLTIEDTIDNVGRTMMGLTISCARCHDHKFDPISAKDYYGLYGIFASTRYPFPGIELFQTQRDLVPLVDEDEVRRQHGPYQAKTDELIAKLDKALEICRQRGEQNAKLEKSATLDEKRKMRSELDALLGKARQDGNRLADHLRTLPELPSAYAVQDAKPVDAFLQIKGEPTRPGAVVPRGFPNVLGGQRLSDEAANTSGRLELAKWITSPDNPLTARVIVNRVWQRHFGKGLVTSTSDFGLRGESPTHPQLLDWLARDFIRNGWSLKHLHRRILNSRTYRLSSHAVETNLAADPTNQWRWRHDRQRLDAESIRDTLLLLGGTLDGQPQSQPHPFPPKAEWKFTQHHPFKDEYESNKRSVYGMTKRLTGETYLQTFDGPDPNVCTSDRDQSITALQALYFVNDGFLHQQASLFANRLPSDQNDRSRIKQAFQTVVCRTPSDEEVSVMFSHLVAVRRQAANEPQCEELAWASLSRSLFRLNEFLYVD
ncbi:MAG: DUF1553 domain-containing protein [Planctomycetota bacterium]